MLPFSVFITSAPSRVSANAASANAATNSNGEANNWITAAAAAVKHSSDSSTDLLRPQPLSSVSAIALAMMPRNSDGSGSKSLRYQHAASTVDRARNTRNP